MAVTYEKVLNDNDRYVMGHIYALENATVVELFNHYAASFDRLKDAVNATWSTYVTGETWTADDAAFRVRTESLVRQISAEMDRLAAQSTDTTLRSMVASYQATAMGKAWNMDVLTNSRTTTLPLLPIAAIRAQLLRPYEGNTFVDRYAEAKEDFRRDVRRALVASQIEGDGIMQAQRRLADTLGIELSDRGNIASKSARANFNRTQMIARTEILRASNTAALATYKENEDRLAGWQWSAANDDRTCGICGDLDGNVYPVDSTRQPPPAHPQCRCSAIPRIKNVDLESRIVTPRPTYNEWKQQRGLSGQDGGVFELKKAKPPKLG